MCSAVRIVNKKRFIFWQSFFFVFILILSAYVLLRSPIFTISNIHVKGNTTLSTSEVIRVSGIVTGMNTFKADLKSAGQKVTALPVVKNVNTYRKLPATVIIEITERTPRALVLVEGKFIEIDDETIYLRKGNVGAAGLPVITEAQPKASGPGRPVEGNGLKTALQVINEMPEDLRDDLSEIHVGEDGRVILYTLEGIQCRLGLPEKINEKGLYFLQVLQELQSKDKIIEYVDFSIISSPVVKYSN